MKSAMVYDLVRPGGYACQLIAAIVMLSVDDA